MKTWTKRPANAMCRLFDHATDHICETFDDAAFELLS